MVDADEFAVGPLDLVLGGLPADPEHLVEVAPVGHQPALAAIIGVDAPGSTPAVFAIAAPRVNALLPLTLA
ncbi:hypothetical protein Misp01_18580 [Microtetraspora sp. NBRC 13810]|nr:hypothetical protein Misp01_18580 [Microtetraspora sp. NBRC 13810]